MQRALPYSEFPKLSIISIPESETNTLTAAPRQQLAAATLSTWRLTVMSSVALKIIGNRLMGIQISGQGRRFLTMVAAILIIAVIILMLPLELRSPAFTLVVFCSPVFGITSWWIQKRHVQSPAFLRARARLFRELILGPAMSTTQRLALSGVNIVSKYSAAIGHFLAPGLELVNRRNRRFLLGIALIGFAHYLLSQKDPVVLSFAFSNALNRTVHIDTRNIDNLLLAVVLLVLAATYIIRTLGAAPTESVVVPEPIRRPSLTLLTRRLVIPLVVAAVLFAALLWQLAQVDGSDSLVVVWIIVLFVVALFGFTYDRQVGTRLSFKINRWDILFIGAIFVGGLVIGSYQLDRLPNSMIGDEGAFLRQANAIALDAGKPEFFDFGVYSFPETSSLYQGLIIKLFGISLWSWRFSSVLAGVLAVIPTYLLTLVLFDRRMAVLASTVMVLTPWFIAFDRMGYNNTQAILPVALTAYLLVVAIQRQSMFYSILSGMAGGLGFYTYSAGRLGIVLGVGYILYLVAARRIAVARKMPEEHKEVTFQEIRTFRLLGAAFVIAALVFAAPLLVYGYAKDPAAMKRKTLESIFPNAFYAKSIYNDDQLYRDVPPIQIDNQTLFFRADLYGALLLRGTIRSMLAFQDADLVRSHYLAAPLAGTVGSVFYFVGLIAASIRIKDRKFGLILIWFLSGVLLLSISNAFPPRPEHMVSVIPAMSILIALGIETCIRFVNEALQLKGPVVTTLLTIVFLDSIIFVNVQNYFYEVPRIYTPDPENVIAFAALQLQQPRNLIYVSDDPEKASFSPFLVSYLPNQARFKTVILDPSRPGPYAIRPGEDYTFYFLPNKANLVVPFLRQTFPEDVITPESYTNSEGKAVLLSWSFDQTSH